MSIVKWYLNNLQNHHQNHDFILHGFDRSLLFWFSLYFNICALLLFYYQIDFNLIAMQSCSLQACSHRNQKGSKKKYSIFLDSGLLHTWFRRLHIRWSFSFIAYERHAESHFRSMQRRSRIIVLNKYINENLKMIPTTVSSNIIDVTFFHVSINISY